MVWTANPTKFWSFAVTGAFFSSFTAYIEGNLHVYAQLLSYSHEITPKKTITTLFFFLGKLANVLLRNFITTHLEHFLKHWYNALMVAQKSCGCLCRLTTSFAVHINVTKIAISTSTWYFDTVKKASLCKRANSQEPLLPAQEILIFITLSSDFACANMQIH